MDTPTGDLEGAVAAGNLGVALRHAETHPLRMLGPGTYELVALFEVLVAPDDVAGLAWPSLAGRCWGFSSIRRETNGYER